MSVAELATESSTRSRTSEVFAFPDLAKAPLRVDAVYEGGTRGD